MENELLQSIGRLYTEALRLQSMVQQLQEQIVAKDAIIAQLQVPSVSATKLPPELVATATPDGFVSADGL